MAASDMWAPAPDAPQAAADPAEPVQELVVDASYDERDASDSDFDHSAWVSRAVDAASAAIYHEPKRKARQTRETGGGQQRKQRFAKVRSAGLQYDTATLDATVNETNDPWEGEYMATRALEPSSTLEVTTTPDRRTSRRRRKQRGPDHDEGQQGWDEEGEPITDWEVYPEPRGTGRRSRSASHGVMAERSGRLPALDLRDTGAGFVQGEGPTPRRTRRHRSSATPRSLHHSTDLVPRSARSVNRGREVEVDASLEVEETYIS